MLVIILQWASLVDEVFIVGFFIELMRVRAMLLFTVLMKDIYIVRNYNYINWNTSIFDASVRTRLRSRGTEIKSIFIRS